MNHQKSFAQWQKQFYNSKEWITIRNKVRKKAGMRCARCKHLITGKSIVDHIIPITPNNIHNKDITINESNLQLLCLQCHNEKTFRKKEINFDLKDRNINLF